MASNTTFGAVLREAREHRGMDVQSIARQMRVRADIIRAIENNDFTRMPPRGYAKNMVATYARIVGVNQTTITRMYLEAANAYETGKMKNDSSRVPNMRSQRSSRGSSSRQADNSSRRSSGRLMFDDRHDTRGTARGNDHVHTSRRPLSPGSPQYTNLYAAPQNVTQQRPKLPLLIGIGVIAVIIIIICVFVFGGKESKPAQETPTVPITGLSDTSNKQAQGDSESTSNSDSHTQQSSVAPTKATFTYKVASGSSVYIEIYEGDSSSASVAETVAGPAEKSFDVTTKLRFISDASSAVEVTVDGEKVDLTENSNGMYDYTVDFSQILAKWQQDHRPVVLVVERNLKRFSEIDFDVVIQQHEKHHLFFVEQRNLDEEHDPHNRRISKEAHMAKESSFDIVSTVDIQEVDNAFQQAKREISQRYDLKDSGAEITLDKQNKTLGIHAPADFVARQVKDVIGSKLVKRGIELTAVKWGEPQAATGQSVRLSATIVDGIDKETASKTQQGHPQPQAEVQGDHRRRQAPRLLGFPRHAPGGHRLPERPRTTANRFSTRTIARNPCS